MLRCYPNDMKNECAKMRKKNNPYEVWQAGNWLWYVLKKWQVNDDAPYARWLCFVVTPMCPDGEMGDVYASEIKRAAHKLEGAELESAIKNIP